MQTAETLSSDMSPSGRTPVLELVDVSKSFFGVKAVKHASLDCYPGEVHALVGENGAGKSTLIKIASGALKPDSGALRVGGETVPRPTTRRVRELGVLTAYQDTSLVAGLSVAENVVLSFHGVRPLGLRAPLQEAARLTKEVAKQFDLPFGPNDRVAELTPASRQLLEVVRALIHNARVLILDEPTAALDLAHTQQLEAMIASILEKGTSVLYITHRLDEVRRMATRLTVLRNGEITGSYEGQGWNSDEVVALMLGVPTELAFPNKREPTDRVPEGLRLRHFHGTRFGPIDLDVGGGEIVGIAGAEGNGQRELMRSIVGLLPADGEVAVHGEDVSVNSPASALRSGIAFLSGDRAAESMFAALSVMDNSTIGDAELSSLGVVMRSREKQAFDRVADQLKVVRASPDQPISELSGGNQQKIVLTRPLLSPTKVVVIDEPTQGVDAGARLDIYHALRDQANEGVAVLVCSSDAAELEGLCDRVYVMSRGDIVTELSAGSVKEEDIVASFVDVSADGKKGSESRTTAERRGPVARYWQRWSGIAPLGVLGFLIIGLGAYAQSNSEVFLTSDNLTNLLTLTLPLAVVALGIQVALLAGEFDISVGSTMSLTVVLASFWATGASAASTIPGLLGLVAVGIVIGLGNALIVRGFGVSPIVGTIGMLSVLSGIAILLRPQPEGLISFGLTEFIGNKIGFIPIMFLVVVAIAILSDLWRSQTSSGLTFRAAGLDETSTNRTGAQVVRLKVLAYIGCAVFAVLAGILLGAQVGSGTNNAGAAFPLLAYSACFIGGAALSGGKGSFVGALLGALFLSMLTNITPLVNLPDSTAQWVAGLLTIVAVLAFRERLAPGAGRRRRNTAAIGSETEDDEVKV